MNKNYRGVLTEMFSEETVESCCMGEWVNIHSRSTVLQDKSIKMMVDVLHKGYKLDIITKDGKRFDNVTPAEAKIKICYNCSVSAPDNGIVTWRPHIADFTTSGPIMAAPIAGTQYAAECILNKNTFMPFDNTNPETVPNYPYEGTVVDLLNGISPVFTPAEPKEPENKYLRPIKIIEAYDINGAPIQITVEVDVYDVITAFGPMGPALQHACKKVLCAGRRGHKDRLQDLNDIIASVKREIEL